MKPITSDPTGEVYGFPTYRWGDAPKYLMTRRALSKAGLRKGGQDPVAVMRHYDTGWQVAYLYDSTKAAKKRPWTPAKQRAVQAAADAKKVCRACYQLLDYVPRGHMCEACHDDPTRWRTTMRTRLVIDYADGSCELRTDTPNGARDLLRLMCDVEKRVNRTRVLRDVDGRQHLINTSRVDRMDFTWEPPADQPAAPAPAEHREPVSV